MMNKSNLNLVLKDFYENLYSMLINFIMLINYANQLCKLMSGQIDEMSEQNEDLKRHMSC